MITYFHCFYSHDNDRLSMNDNEFQVHTFKCVGYGLQAVMDTNTVLPSFIIVEEKNGQRWNLLKNSVGNMKRRQNRSRNTPT